MTYPTERIPGYHLYFLGADYFFVTPQQRLTDRLIATIIRKLFPDADHATITNDMMTVAYCAIGSDCFIYYL